MKKRIVLWAAAGLLCFSGCSGKKAEEMYETAQFEEVQRNYEHAAELYRRILEKYPDSDAAKRATGRLEALKGKNPDDFQPRS